MVCNKKYFLGLTSLIALSTLISLPSYGAETSEPNNEAAKSEPASTVANSKSKEETKPKKKKKDEGYYSFTNKDNEEHEKQPQTESGYYSSFTTKREMPYAVVPPEAFAPVAIPAPPPLETTPVKPIPAVTPSNAQPGWKDNVGETGSITITRHINQARDYDKNGQYNLAKRHYQEAIRLSPDSIDYQIDFYKASMKAKDWPEAVQTLDKLMFRAPARQKEFLADYGHALFQNQEYDKAVSILRKSLSAGRSLGQVHKDLLNIYLLQSKTDLAVGEYEQLTKFNPNDAELHSDYATVLWRLDRLPQAVVHYKAAARIRPSDAKIQSSLGYALLYSKDFAGAVAAYKKAAALNPGDHKVQESLRFAQQQLNASEQ